MPTARQRVGGEALGDRRRSRRRDRRQPEHEADQKLKPAGRESRVRAGWAGHAQAESGRGTAALQDAGASYYAPEPAPAFGLRLSFWRFFSMRFYVLKSSKKAPHFFEKFQISLARIRIRIRSGSRIRISGNESGSMK